MRVMFVGVIVLVSLAAACLDDDGNGSTTTPGNGVLHLRGYDITPENFRSTIRLQFIGQGSTLCEAIRGKSPSEAVDALNELLETGLPADVALPNATPISDQARRSREDEERAAQIALEECAAQSRSDASEAMLATLRFE